MMTPDSARSFAAWLMKDQPQLFIELAKSAGIPTAQPLSGFADVMSAFGAGLSSTVKSVGSYLSSAQGQTMLTTLGTTYLATKAQKDALDLQLKQAQAGQMAAPIQTAYNPQSGAYEVLYTAQNGQQVPVTSANQQQLFASGAAGVMNQPWFPYAAAAGVAMLLWFLILRPQRR
jgi:hypothetical protein